MSKEVICREAQIQDQNSIVEFQILMAFETEQLRLDPVVCRKGVAALFDYSYYGKYYVAEKNGNIIRCLLIIPEWSDWRNGLVWWIHSVYVIASERGKGSFSTLYKFIKASGLSTETFRGLRLYVDKKNLFAQELYQRLGMSNHHYALYEWMRSS